MGETRQRRRRGTRGGRHLERPDGVHGVQGVGARRRRAGEKRGAAFQPDCFTTPLLTVVPFRRPPTLLPAAQALGLLKRVDRLQTPPSLLPVTHGGRHLPQGVGHYVYT